MDSLFQFMGEHPIVTVLLAWAACSAFCYPFKIMNRYFRHLNIKHKGWPPAHLDADGDWKPKEEEQK